MFLWHVPAPHALPSELSTCFFLHGAVVVKLLLICEAIGTVDVELAEFLPHGAGFDGLVVLLAEVGEDASKVDVFFLHLLVVAAALLSLPRAYE